MSLVRRTHPWAVLLALGLVPSLGGAAPSLAPSPTKAPSSAADVVVSALVRLTAGIEQTQLKNGLRVVLLPDAEAPSVSVSVTYDVGSRDEQKGQSGFAHLFEHMMFQGSRNVKKGEHFQLVSGRGGQLNGTTSADRTNYFETLPKNELPLALWLEADRMRWLDISEENFENQRSVVREEYRMRVNNAAYRPGLIRLDELIFAGYPPYEHPTIGSLPDLDAAPLAWVKDFHARYYVPSNAVLTLVGGFEPREAMALVHQYFDAVPARPQPQTTMPPLPPITIGEQRVEVIDANAKTPALAFGWRIPKARTKDHFALEATARILGDGESSLLYDLLVRKRALARDVSVWTADRRDVDSFIVFVELSEQAEPETVISLVDEELAKLAASGVAPSRLERSQARARASFVFSLQSTQSRATTLGEYAVIFGDPRLVANDLEELLKTQPTDIQRVVRTHLSKPTRRLVVIQPSSLAGAHGASQP